MEIETSQGDFFSVISEQPDAIIGQHKEYSSPCSLSQETLNTHSLTLLGDRLVLQG
jgi:hypothetical protein